MDYFICKKCAEKVYFNAPGTKNRNHCPYCLFSYHLDQDTGDRSSECRGLMEPIGKFYKPDGEEVLVHKCIKCGKISKNRVAGDDDYEAVGKLPEINRDDYGF